MSKLTASNLFMVTPFGIQQAGFYQELLRGISNHEQLGNRLIRLAEQAHAFRQFDRVKEIGQILFNFPLKQFSSIGAYFLGVALNSCGNGDQDKAKRMFERVVDIAPDKYKAKAILSLAAVSFNTKAYDAALHFYNETIKVAPVSSSSVHAVRTIAIIKSMEGQHHAALKDLESLYTLSKYTAPHVYFDYLNSYAVELGEAGRKDEARNIMRHVLASPFARVYPEWQQTAADLQGGSRSMVQVVGSRAKSASPVNVFSLPPAQKRVVKSSPAKPAKVFSLAEWKEKMVKDNEPDENIDAMDRSDLIVKLLELINKEDVDEAKLRKVVKFAEATMTRRKPPNKPPDKPAS